MRVNLSWRGHGPPGTDLIHLCTFWLAAALQRRPTALGRLKSSQWLHSLLAGERVVELGRQMGWKLFFQSKQGIVLNVIRIDQNAIDGLLFVQLRFCPS